VIVSINRFITASPGHLDADSSFVRRSFTVIALGDVIVFVTGGGAAGICGGAGRACSRRCAAAGRPDPPAAADKLGRCGIPGRCGYCGWPGRGGMPGCCVRKTG